MELVCQLLPSPISTRLYDTYPETVKVSREPKGQRQWPNARPHGALEERRERAQRPVKSALSRANRPRAAPLRRRARQEDVGRALGKPLPGNLHGKSQVLVRPRVVRPRVVRPRLVRPRLVRPRLARLKLAKRRLPRLPLLKPLPVRLRRIRESSLRARRRRSIVLAEWSRAMTSYWRPRHPHSTSTGRPRPRGLDAARCASASPSTTRRVRR